MSSALKILLASVLALGSCAYEPNFTNVSSDHVKIEPLGYNDLPWPVIILSDREMPTAPLWTLEGAMQSYQHRIVVSRARLDREFLAGRDACARDGTRIETDFGDVGVSGRTARRGRFHCRLGPQATCAYLADLKDRSPSETTLLDAIRDMRLRLGCITLEDEAAG